MKTLVALALLVYTVSGNATQPPPETEHFAPLLGSWLVSGRGLSSDGQNWNENPHPALWRFYRILNGHGIQDDWTSPAPHVEVDESTRNYGTNIRIFDATKEQWAMAWIGSTNRALLTFTATSTNDEIIMNSVGMDPPRRNIFHNMSSDRFSWRQEWSFDEGETWVAVAYLEATRWNDKN
ncbi:MAG: hypothetical protein O7G86_18335 [Gammaproteobacteria bacterium]|nr:hypothetical protein [Gammaproteobacteria bacterium]MCZ6855877.1 hypothetical protein [Gammaproteobacteria bacterium]